MLAVLQVSDVRTRWEQEQGRSPPCSARITMMMMMIMIIILILMTMRSLLVLSPTPLAVIRSFDTTVSRLHGRRLSCRGEVKL